MTHIPNPHAVALGRLGGRAGKGKTSPAKAAAARANGQLGGRPPRGTPAGHPRDTRGTSRDKDALFWCNRENP